MSSRRNEVIRIDGLKKYFMEGDTLLRRLRPDAEVQTVRAVDDVDLTVYEGDTLGLVGESGCGKSTLARTVLQLIEPTAGAVYFHGESVTEYGSAELRSFRGDVQMVFQDPFSSLNPRYTVRRTLVEPMRTHDVGESAEDRTRRAELLLDRVGLGGEHLDRYPHEFSGGQRQRIAIARALAVEPKVIVADEPVSALDVSVQAQILNLLEELQAEMNLTMLFISHDLSVVRQICDRVAVMYLGRVVEEATTTELFEDPKHPYAEVLVSSIPTPDPTHDRTRTTLDGDVPTPIDPPSGCRFHPRCPKVIPPNDWEHDQDAWRHVLQFKTRVQGGDVQSKAMREQLEAQRPDPVTDGDVVEALYEKHLLEGGLTQDERVTLPEPVEETVRRALSLVVEGRRTKAVEVLDEAFSTVCERTQPPNVTVGDGHTVVCHLHTGEPSATEKSVRPESTNE